MADTRLKSYKNKGLDVEEMRRRREDEGLQIRKSKRDEQVRTMKMHAWTQTDIVVCQPFAR